MNIYLYNVGNCELLITPHSNISYSLQEVRKVVNELEIDPLKRSREDLETIEKTQIVVETIRTNYLNNQSSTSKYIRRKLQDWKWLVLEKFFFKTEFKIEKTIEKISLLISDKAKDHYLNKFGIDEANFTESVKIYKETTKNLKKSYKEWSEHSYWPQYVFNKLVGLNINVSCPITLNKVQVKALADFFIAKIDQPTYFNDHLLFTIYTSNDVGRIEKFLKIVYPNYPQYNSPLCNLKEKCTPQVYNLVLEKHFPNQIQKANS